VSASQPSSSDPPDRLGDPDDSPVPSPLHIYRATLRGYLVEGRLRSLSPGWLPSPRGTSHSPRRLVSVLAALALRRSSDGSGDLMAPEPFDPGPALVLGLSPLDLFREALGRSSAPAGGRNGLAGWTDLSLGLVGPVATPGAMVEVMAGVTLAERMKGSRRVGLVASSPGASATGAWHEGLNFAAVRTCPLVLLVVTPGPSEQSPSFQRLETRLERQIDRARGYGVSSHLVSVSELPELYRTLTGAVEEARQGAGVQLVEVSSADSLGTSDSLGESGDLPGTLARLRHRIEDEGLVAAAGLTQLESELRGEVDEAWERASSETRAAPPPQRPFMHEGATSLLWTEGAS
jgi:TPP-dependent pyruvate/acetoin dehydrogenase alpha subunit